jgi:hypothetical protein
MMCFPVNFMNSRSHNGQIAMTIFLGLAFFAGSVFVEARAADQFQNRVAFADKLLNDSPEARQVMESDDEAAKKLRARALEKFAAALEARDSGKVDEARTGLSDAMSLMYAAVRETHQEDGASEKSNRDFRNRRASVDALLSAHQRISEEKGLQAEHERLRQDVTVEVVAAEEILKSGDAKLARQQLDGAYDKVRLSVKELRDGDTLVRELRFASKEDEYRYELDRNDTHQMLVKVLLEDRLQNEGVRERVTSLVSSAGDLRALAESQAGEGEFAEAVETLERSTAELVKAIRGAGVYIPG